MARESEWGKKKYLQNFILNKSKTIKNPRNEGFLLYIRKSI